MNPYTDQVLNKTVSDMGRAQDAREHALDAQATAAGAFGDTGWGQARAESNRNFADSVGAVSNQARSQAFDKAMGQINQNRALYDQLGQQFQGLDQWRTARGSALAGYLDRFANEDRAVRQMKDNVGYSDYLQPQQNLMQLMAMLNQTPHLTHQYGTRTEHGTEQGRTEQSQPNTGGFGLLGKLAGMGLGSFMGPGGSALGGMLGGSLGGSLGGGGDSGGGTMDGIFGSMLGGGWGGDPGSMDWGGGDGGDWT
jgi:hypothetical protein